MGSIKSPKARTFTSKKTLAFPAAKHAEVGVCMTYHPLKSNQSIKLPTNPIVGRVHARDPMYQTSRYLHKYAVAPYVHAVDSFCAEEDLRTTHAHDKPHFGRESEEHAPAIAGQVCRGTSVYQTYGYPTYICTFPVPQPSADKYV